MVALLTVLIQTMCVLHTIFFYISIEIKPTYLCQFHWRSGRTQSLHVRTHRRYHYCHCLSIGLRHCLTTSRLVSESYSSPYWEYLEPYCQITMMLYGYYTTDLVCVFRYLLSVNTKTKTLLYSPHSFPSTLDHIVDHQKDKKNTCQYSPKHNVKLC